MYINKPRLSISRRCPRNWLRSSQPTLASLWPNQPTRKFYCTHYTDIYGKHIQTAQNGKRATESSKLEEQHPVFILCCTQSLFRLRSQCHFPLEANPPLSLRCPSHHGGFTPDAEAPCREAIVSASSLFSPLAASVSRQETHWKMSCMCDHGAESQDDRRGEMHVRCKQPSAGTRGISAALRRSFRFRCKQPSAGAQRHAAVQP